MKIDFKQNDITHTDDIISDLKLFLKNHSSSQIFILTDKNCKKLCFPIIEKVFDEKIKIFTVISEEKYKSLETVTEIWKFLLTNQADRNSLLINLGGGIVTDMGGFAASTFKRGIPFINIPTTLLAQIDASVGGKTGINFLDIKNQIGTITLPEKVFIFSGFLKTLKKDEFLSGFGEMLKHALIFDEKHYFELIDFINTDFPKKNYQNFDSLILKSVNIKTHFVKNDISEKGIRKILNFGHTFGHAFESLFNQKNKPIKHGAAVVYGMICELYLSVKKYNFPKEKFSTISEQLLYLYPKIIIPENDFDTVFEFMLHDKKNMNKTIQCVLLKDVEIPVYKVIIEKNGIYNSLRKLNKKSKELSKI